MVTVNETDNERELRLGIRRKMMRFVVDQRRTLKVAATYLPYLFPMIVEGLIQVGDPYRHPQGEHFIVDVSPNTAPLN